jgi:hypothetical protein
MSFSLQKLTEGIRDRHVGQQNKRLVEKWSRTGLLRGMEEVNRENMATLLENQAAQVLRESNTMGSDAVGGFTNIAFPIVRRVFGGLVANELVSIQPMSLPSGLLFYLDYTYGSNAGGAGAGAGDEGDTSSVYQQGKSIYGNPDGKSLQDGALGVGGQYDLAGSGFSRVHVLARNSDNDADITLGTLDAAAAADKFTVANADVGAYNSKTVGALTTTATLKTDNLQDLKALSYDEQIISRIDDLSEKYVALHLTLAGHSDAGAHNPFGSADLTAIKDAALVITDISGKDDLEPVSSEVQPGQNVVNVRRLNQLGTWDNATGIFTPDANVTSSTAGAAIRMIVRLGTALAGADNLSGALCKLSFVKADNVAFGNDGMVDGTPAFESNMAASGGDISPVIPEIDIKIESIPVTAQTRKLRARWSPELAQDLNAYHSMDAEVELTQILSEQIALEIDREILNDLLVGAKGANFFWSRSPGKFVNKRTGAEVARTSTLNPGPAFTGTVREWYETLTETVIDVANEIHRKTLRGSANFIVVSPDVATILEASVLYRPSYSLDGDGQVGAPFTMGAEKMGTLSNRFTVYKDPYFPRNKILVGYKGGSYLETGFVYAPYVPLIVTPTIFQPEDFTPRKGVMTRYGKKMVRADFYGTVTCLDMNII